MATEVEGAEGCVGGVVTAIDHFHPQAVVLAWSHADFALGPAPWSRSRMA